MTENDNSPVAVDSDTREPDGYYSFCGHPFWFGGPSHHCDALRAYTRAMLEPKRRWWRFWE